MPERARDERPSAWHPEHVQAADSSSRPLTVADPRISAISTLLERRFGSVQRILVVGCGNGTEAALLADLLDTDVTGIDIKDAFDEAARARATLLVADAEQLPFDDGSFDLVFSFHVLEHVASPTRAVSEMRRVLPSSGGIWLGTPNRHRAVGYLGSRDVPIRDKVRWNLGDWNRRLHGGFRNELGAHAGFTAAELRALLEPIFNVVHDETQAYYTTLYARHRRSLAVIRRVGLAGVVLPAVYFAARC
jgi:SAM-dependent methyltransferase